MGALVIVSTVLVEVKVLACIGHLQAVVNRAVALWVTDVCADVVIESLGELVAAFECIMSLTYFVDVLSNVVVEADTSVEVLSVVNANVSIGVMTALEFPMSMP